MPGIPSRLSGLIDTWPLHQTIRDVSWVVPAVQTVHILSIAVVFSSAIIIALRATNISAVEWSPARWGHRLNWWVGISLVLLLLTGLVLIVGEPERELLSPIFQLKMVLVVTAATLSWVLATRLQRLAPNVAVGLPDRSLAILLVLIWMAIIAAGRWVAYYAG